MPWKQTPTNIISYSSDIPAESSIAESNIKSSGLQKLVGGWYWWKIKFSWALSNFMQKSSRIIKLSLALECFILVTELKGDIYECLLYFGNLVTAH